MRRKGFIVTGSADEVRQMLSETGDKSNWPAAKALTQTEVDLLADEDDGPLPAGWEDTVVLGVPARKQAVHIRLDADVLTWFRDRGPGYQTRINAVLRSFVQLRQNADDKKAG